MKDESHIVDVSRRSRLVSLLFLLGTLLSSTAFAQTTFSRTQFGTALDPFCVARADFDTNGDVDIATASFSEHAVAVQFGDGTGHFSVPSKFATGNAPQCVYQADVNHDGQADLIVTGTGPDSVSVLLGTGGGSFEAPHVTPLPMQAQDLAMGRFNDDTNVDLATVDSTTASVTLLRGNGDGTFVLSSLPISGAMQLRSIVSADLNKDGKVDLAVLDCCTGTDSDAVSQVYSLLGNGSLGFTKKLGLRAHAIAGAIQTADLDNNGSADILLTYANAVNWVNKNGVAFLSGKNSGYFSLVKTFAIDAGFDQPVGQNKPIVANLDGKGRLDVALAGSKNADSGSDFEHPSAYFFVWYVNSDGSLRGHNNVTIADPGYPTGSDAFDVNGDAKVDLIAMARTGDTAALVVLENNRASTSCSTPGSSTGLNLCSPTDGATTSSPVQVLAQGGSAVTTIEAWIDGKKVGQVSGTRLTLSVVQTAGTHKLTLFAKHNSTITATLVAHFSVQ